MIDIDWAAFGIVLGVSFVAAVGIVSFYSLGLRLLGVGETESADGTRHDSTTGRSPLATAGAYICFAICIAAVLFGLWVLIPQFH